jgi:hypothetical protein
MVLYETYLFWSEATTHAHVGRLASTITSAERLPEFETSVARHDLISSLLLD